MASQNFSVIRKAMMKSWEDEMPDYSYVFKDREGRGAILTLSFEGLSQKRRKDITTQTTPGTKAVLMHSAK